CGEEKGKATGDSPSSTSRPQTPSESNDVVAEKEKLIKALRDQVNTQITQISFLKKTAELQMAQIQSQDKEITQWKIHEIHKY
ncbi:unnamed protein product, partial [Didymodactylos carnosus]